MTREEARSILEPQNPTTDGHAVGSPYYEELMELWITAYIAGQPSEEELMRQTLDTLQTQANELYMTFPLEVRARFAYQYAASKDFLSRGDWEAAYALIEGTAVGDEVVEGLDLADAKAQILALFPS